MNEIINGKTPVAENKHQHEQRKLSPFGRLFRFVGLWFGFTGLYATFAVCPFCGQAGCPVGLATSGTIGAFFALCLQDWKILFRYLKHKLAGHSNEKIKLHEVAIPDRKFNISRKSGLTNHYRTK